MDSLGPPPELPDPAAVDRIRGCLLGGAIGDAAGSAFEGRPPGRYDWRDAPWQLSDDTQLTLATCEALTEGPPDPQTIAEALLRWHRSRRFSGLGASTLKALRDLAAGAHWSLAGRGGERAAGNGVAMRIAPLAFCLDARKPESRADDELSVLMALTNSAHRYSGHGVAPCCAIGF